MRFTSIRTATQKILQKNGFLSYHGYEKVVDTYNTTIEYKKLKPTDSRYFNEYLEKELLSRVEFPDMSHLVHEKISESIQEMFVNAQIHSETEYIYTCGQFFPQDKKLNFTIVDTGIGFAKRIEKNLLKKIDHSDAITWAMVDGNTTKQNSPGGLGLAILKEFITQNKGRIQIISGDAMYELYHGVETIQVLNNEFNGTVISMTFSTDDTTVYRFIEEIENDDIF